MIQTEHRGSVSVMKSMLIRGASEDSVNFALDYPSGDSKFESLSAGRTNGVATFDTHEDRTFFERCREEDNVYQQGDLERVRIENKDLQQALKTASDQLHSYELIHHDLELRLETMAKQKISADKKLMEKKRRHAEEMKTASTEVASWKKKYEAEELRGKKLSETIRNLEKELYMMHLRKYEMLGMQSEPCVSTSRRSGGLPSPIHVDTLHDDKNSFFVSKYERVRRAEEKAATIIATNRVNVNSGDATTSDKCRGEIYALAEEISKQRGHGEMVRGLSIFFGV